MLNPRSPQSAAPRDGLGRKILHLRGLPPASRDRSGLCRVRLSVLATEGLRGTRYRPEHKPAPASASKAGRGPRRGVPEVNGPIVGGSGRGDPRDPAVAARPHTDSFRQHQLLKSFLGAAELCGVIEQPSIAIASTGRKACVNAPLGPRPIMGWTCRLQHS